MGLQAVVMGLCTPEEVQHITSASNLEILLVVACLNQFWQATSVHDKK